ncbi:MAG: protease inhibitor I42 family protein [Bacteroidales bacterium]
MQQRICFSLYFVALLLLTSCSADPITEKHDGSTVTFSIGSEFEVMLKGYPDKGFMWKVVGVNDDVIEQIGEPDVRSAKETGKNYGTYTFTFKTVSAGNTVLRMIYYNKNFEDPVPENAFELKIISGTIGRITS